MFVLALFTEIVRQQITDIAVDSAGHLLRTGEKTTRLFSAALTGKYFYAHDSPSSVTDTWNFQEIPAIQTRQ